jgi:hypothetical protein
MTLPQLAEEALQNLRVEMLPLLLFQPPTWEPHELAIAPLRITNETGSPLREVAVEPYVFQDSGVVEFTPCGTWDGRSALRDSLEPGEVWAEDAVNPCWPALLRALSPGTFQLAVLVSAEVVPWGNAPFAIAEYSVQ